VGKIKEVLAVRAGASRFLGDLREPLSGALANSHIATAGDPLARTDPHIRPLPMVSSAGWFTNAQPIEMHGDSMRKDGGETEHVISAGALRTPASHQNHQSGAGGSVNAGRLAGNRSRFPARQPLRPSRLPGF
jgi:hypothetical protein